MVDKVHAMAIYGLHPTTKQMLTACSQIYYIIPSVIQTMCRLGPVTIRSNVNYI